LIPEEALTFLIKVSKTNFLILLLNSLQPKCRYTSRLGQMMGLGMFWQALEKLHAWERGNIPGANTALGTEVLIWLLKSKKRPRALKDLYRSSRFSEPTIRNLLRSYSDHGLVILESNGDDMRSRFARATPKLDLILAEYRQRFQELAGMAKDDGFVGPLIANSRQTGPGFKLTGQLTSFRDAEARPSRQA
jgi:hypothetical protein